MEELPSVTLRLVCVGETETDSGRLTALGTRQVRLAVERLRRMARWPLVPLVLSSGWRGSDDTAGILAAALWTGWEECDWAHEWPRTTRQVNDIVRGLVARGVREVVVAAHPAMIDRLLASTGAHDVTVRFLLLPLPVTLG
jgi:phosphohistidine phosphatase SixA